MPVAGDWTGSGTTTIGLYNPATSTFYERDTNTSGSPDASFNFGPPGSNWIPPGSNWMPVAGDWTGSGTTDIGLLDPVTSFFYERNSNAAGLPDNAFQYGPSGLASPWEPVIGSWYTPGQPELAAQVGTAQQAASISPLTSALLQPIVTAAIARWTTAGVPAQDVQILDDTRVVIGNLPGAELGEYLNDTITISPNAAGNGWFIDPTPNADEEFSSISGSESLQAIVPQAVDRIDLLTVVEHELGHAIGLADLPAGADSLMGDTLPVGIRRTPDAAAVVAVFAAL
jgi:hypothetical protein